MNSSPRRSGRLRVAIALGAAGALLTAGLGTVLVVSTTAAIQDYDDTWSLITRTVEEPAPTRIDSPSPISTEAAAAREPGLSYEQPTPTAAPDGHRYDQWGARLYDDTDTAADFTYPSSLVGDELANARSWVDMQLLIADCMTEKGHDYTFQLRWEVSPENEASGLPAVDSDAWKALYGSNLTASGPYDWTQAGCHGQVVHEMGNDDAH